jgi:hypothetical protein
VDYWADQSFLSSTPAHALDLLICITISSPSASKLVESLQGEEVVRCLMEKHTAGKGGQQQKKEGSRRAVTLDQVQDNPLAIKCAEFLLFFEYEREEPARQKARLEVAVDESTILNDSFRSAINQSFQHRPKKERKERTREGSGQRMSPAKATRGTREAVKARREDRVQAVRSRPLQSTMRLDVSRRNAPTTPSPTDAVFTSPQKMPNITTTKSSLTPFTKAMSPRKARGRSRSRSPLSVLQQEDRQHSSRSMPTSPLKAIMGPSPAVQRAHARSISPVKRPLHHHLVDI